MTFMKLSDVDVSWSSVSFCVTKQCPAWPHACCCRTMDWLMRHLYRMSLQSERTGMTSKNLAIVWSPNILRCDVSELDTQDALQVQHSTPNTQHYNIIKHRQISLLLLLTRLLDCYSQYIAPYLALETIENLLKLTNSTTRSEHSSQTRMDVFKTHKTEYFRSLIINITSLFLWLKVSG